MHAPAPRLAILGLGNMGEAILRGLTGRDSAPASFVCLYDPSSARQEALADLAAVQWHASAADAVRDADLVLLAVKPQAMAGLLDEMAPIAAARLFVSIAAGITTSYIEARLPGARVVRTMPNTPLLVGKGVVALCAGRSASSEDLAAAKSLFPGAMLLDVEEPVMDAVTAVSGSGPAYFFAFVEALASAARDQGFNADTAYRLAAGTFIGAAALLEQSGASAAELRSRVTSPGGTTQAALTVLREADLAGIVRTAVDAATRRGQELSQS